MTSLHEKKERLQALLRAFDGCVVAYSGGVDSALIAKVAFDELGPRALAVTGVSPSLATSEWTSAVVLARTIGIAHQTVATREIDQEAYRRNDARRCFYCKDELYSRLRDLAVQKGFEAIANGTNDDDRNDYRPGMVAAARWNVRSPLAELEITKSEVRELARQYGLSVADKPASPCLASRIAHGETVTAARLRMIEHAEDFLRTLGCLTVRVRLHADDIARIEVDIPTIARLADEDTRRKIVERFHELGFRFVTLDLEGFRSGSLSAIVQQDGLLPIVELGTNVSSQDLHPRPMARQIK